MKPTDHITSEEAANLVFGVRDEMQVQIDSLQRQVEQLLQLRDEVDLLKSPPPPPDRTGLQSPMAQCVTVDDSTKSITLADANGNKIVLGPDGITLHSAQAITLKSTGGIALSSMGSLVLAAEADASVSGLNVTVHAEVAAAVKGAASAELSASGQTVVRGVMVMIN